MRKARSKTNKVLDIALSEEKFYFPGETIRGSIIVKPKSSMKVNPIIIKFSGAIYISAKEKEVIPLFQQVESIPINEGKSKVLEPKQYSFPFEFLVPNNSLPSAMDFGKNKTARINYKLTVILDRPMMPESLCPKIEYPVLVMEYVDVTKDNFTKVLEKQKEVKTFNNGKCHAKLSVPRTGFTRGETIPVNIIVNTFSSFIKKESLVIELIRKVKIHTSRNTLDEEHILKSNKFDLNIIGPYNFTQSITSHLLIRTTPPTIRYKDRILRVHYKIRAQVFTDKKATPSVILELPIIIGTWPRADVPIDDDDDDEIIQNMGEVMISDEIDDDDEEEDLWMQEQEEIEFQKRQSSTGSITVTAPSPTSATTTNSSSSLYYNQGNIRRSGSNNSLGSISSWRSVDHRRISTATTHTIPEVSSNYQQQQQQQRNTLPPTTSNSALTTTTPATTSDLNGYLNRSSSTPDLLSNPPVQQPILQHQQSIKSSTSTRVIDPTLTNQRNSYYETTHRSSKSLHSIHPTYLNQPQPQQHRRVGSDEFNSSSSSSIATSFMSMPPVISDVPNHTLTFLSSTSAPPQRIITQQPQQQQQQQMYHNNSSLLDELPSEDEEDDEDDDSDDDLFAIIEKKKRKEAKEQKKRQRSMMYPTAPTTTIV